MCRIAANVNLRCHLHCFLQTALRLFLRAKNYVRCETLIGNIFSRISARPMVKEMRSAIERWAIPPNWLGEASPQAGYADRKIKLLRHAWAQPAHSSCRLISETV